MDKLYVDTCKVLSCIRLHCYRCPDANLELIGDDEVGRHMPTTERWTCDDERCRLYPYRFGGEPVRDYSETREE